MTEGRKPCEGVGYLFGDGQLDRGAARKVPALGCEFFGGITQIAKSAAGDTEESVSTLNQQYPGRAGILGEDFR